MPSAFPLKPSVPSNGSVSDEEKLKFYLSFSGLICGLISTEIVMQTLFIQINNQDDKK